MGASCAQASIRSWFPLKDSNLDFQSQNLTCYHCTKGEQIRIPYRTGMLPGPWSRVNGGSWASPLATCLDRVRFPLDPSHHPLYGFSDELLAPRLDLHLLILVPSDPALLWPHRLVV